MDEPAKRGKTIENVQPEPAGGGQKPNTVEAEASQEVPYGVDERAEEFPALPTLGTSPASFGAGESKKRKRWDKRWGKSQDSIPSPSDHAIGKPKVVVLEDAETEQTTECRVEQKNENSKNFNCQDQSHGQVPSKQHDGPGSDVEREQKRKRSNDKVLSLAELKIQLRAKMAAEAQRLEALLEEDLRAELEATPEAELGEQTGLSSESFLCNDLADTGSRAMQVSGDGQETLFIPEVHLEGKQMQGFQ